MSRVSKEIKEEIISLHNEFPNMKYDWIAGRTNVSSSTVRRTILGLKQGSSRKKDNLHKVYANKDLATFTPRQLIDELKARGYSGELRYTQIINL